MDWNTRFKLFRLRVRMGRTCRVFTRFGFTMEQTSKIFERFYESMPKLGDWIEEE